MNNDREKLHVHDEDCNCECHQNPDPEHQHLHHEHKPITITTHDMSIVGSYKFIIEKPYQEAETILDDLLKQLAKEVIHLNGIIGHIKAFLTSSDKKCMISITEDESTKRYIEPTRCSVEGVAIVFYIEPHQLESLLNKIFKNYI